MSDSAPTPKATGGEATPERAHPPAAGAASLARELSVGIGIGIGVALVAAVLMRH